MAAGRVGRHLAVVVGAQRVGLHAPLQPHVAPADDAVQAGLILEHFGLQRVNLSPALDRRERDDQLRLARGRPVVQENGHSVDAILGHRLGVGHVGVVQRHFQEGRDLYQARRPADWVVLDWPLVVHRPFQGGFVSVLQGAKIIRHDLRLEIVHLAGRDAGQAGERLEAQVRAGRPEDLGDGERREVEVVGHAVAVVVVVPGKGPAPAFGEAAHAPVEFVAVADAVGVAVGVEGVGFDVVGGGSRRAGDAHHFFVIGQPVEVGVGEEGVGAQLEFVAVGQAVAVIVSQGIEVTCQGRDLRAAAFAEVAQVGGERFDRAGPCGSRGRSGVAHLRRLRHAWADHRGDQHHREGDVGQTGQRRARDSDQQQRHDDAEKAGQRGGAAELHAAQAGAGDRRRVVQRERRNRRIEPPGGEGLAKIRVERNAGGARPVGVAPAARYVQVERQPRREAVAVNPQFAAAAVFERIQGQEQADIIGALPGLPEHPGQHVAAVEGERDAREAAAERLDRIEALRILRRFEQQQRVGGEAGRRRGLLLTHPAVALALVDRVANDQDVLRAGGLPGRVLRERAAHLGVGQREARAVRPGDQPFDADARGLCAIQWRVDRARREHRLLHVHGHAIAARLLRLLQGQLQQIIRREVRRVEIDRGNRRGSQVQPQEGEYRKQSQHRQQNSDRFVLFHPTAPYRT